ncbi:MAG: PorP/SprF family type IX secretion system membrane protein, partial [Saprospiraceae bacterium]
MKLGRLLVFCFVVLSTSLSAQDIHFSQFYMSPMTLNPAMTGVMNCNIRLTANYRNQWASVLKSNAYNTYSVAYDQRIPVGRYDYLGVGGTFWGDQAGSLGFGDVTGKLSVSYSKRMAGYRQKSHYLVAGVEAGVAQRRVDLSRAQWGEQHDGDGGFDPTANPNEGLLTLNQNSFIYPDISAGLMWFSVFDKHNNLFVGGAYHHLNRANMTFYDGSSEPQFSKFTFHAGGEFKLSERLAAVPNILTRFQGPSMEIVPGTSLKFLL